VVRAHRRQPERQFRVRGGHDDIAVAVPLKEMIGAGLVGSGDVAVSDMLAPVKTLLISMLLSGLGADVQ
jgi:hypothetical protein